MGRFIRLKRSDYLNQLHNWHRVHEMHTNYLMSTLRNDTADFGNRNGRSVCGKDSMVRSALSKPLENNFLNVEVLVRCLDYKVCSPQLCDIVAISNSVHDILTVFLRQSLLRNLFLAPVRNEIPALV